MTDPATLDALAMAVNCVTSVRRTAEKMLTPQGRFDAHAVGEDTRAAAVARVGAALATVAMAQDIRRAVDLLHTMFNQQDDPLF